MTSASSSTYATKLPVRASQTSQTRLVIFAAFHLWSVWHGAKGHRSSVTPNPPLRCAYGTDTDNHILWGFWQLLSRIVAVSLIPLIAHASCNKLDRLMTSGVSTLLLYQSSEELKGLLETAFTKQKEALVSHWGENADEEGEIDRCHLKQSDL